MVRAGHFVEVVKRPQLLGDGAKNRNYVRSGCFITKYSSNCLMLA
jgi:hypothetical protein